MILVYPAQYLVVLLDEILGLKPARPQQQGIAATQTHNSKALVKNPALRAQAIASSCPLRFNMNWLPFHPTGSKRNRRRWVMAMSIGPENQPVTNQPTGWSFALRTKRVQQQFAAWASRIMNARS
jgi:hypothetical protein